MKREVKGPILVKINDLHQMMQVYPMTLLALGYADREVSNVAQVLDRVTRKLSVLEGRGSVRGDL